MSFWLNSLPKNWTLMNINYILSSPSNPLPKSQISRQKPIRKWIILDAGMNYIPPFHISIHFQPTLYCKTHFHLSDFGWISWFIPVPGWIFNPLSSPPKHHYRPVYSSPVWRGETRHPGVYKVSFGPQRFREYRFWYLWEWGFGACYPILSIVLLSKIVSLIAFTQQ